MNMPNLPKISSHRGSGAVIGHILVTVIGMLCVTGLAMANKVDGATAAVIIVSAMGLAGQSIGRPVTPLAATEPPAPG